jgi:exodeoxyribonuclease VII small subunit
MTNKKENQAVGDLDGSLQELESVVEQLESGDLSLEEALKQFERGVKLTRKCQATLKKAEQKVEILLKKTADAEPEPFDTPDQ